MAMTRATAAMLLLLAAAAGANAELLFPSLTSCMQRAGSTSFRVAPQVVADAASRTYCFAITTGTPNSATSSCGRAERVERFQMFVPYASRRSIVKSTLEWGSGSSAKSVSVSGSYTRKGSDGAYADEVTFSRLEPFWTTDFIKASRPRICITLDKETTLDELCLGAAGKCTIALYSVGANGAKCCPVQQIAIPK